MQTVLSAERSFGVRRAGMQLASAVLVIVLAALVAITLAVELGGSRSPAAHSISPANTRPFGETQQPAHGNLAGGEDGSTIVSGGHGALP